MTGLWAAVGGGVIVAGLGQLAATPLGAFLVLGYAMRVESRRARGASMADACLLWRAAPKVGAAVVGFAPWGLLLAALWGFAFDAAIVDPDGTAVASLRNAAGALSVLLGAHGLIALARGGRGRHFVWPVGSAAWLVRTLQDLATEPRWRWPSRPWSWPRPSEPGAFTSLGIAACAVLGAFVWLAVPVAGWAWFRGDGPGRLVITVLAGAAMVTVLAWLPLLQARLAAEQRWRAMFEVTAVRRLFRRTPLTWTAVIVAAYALTLPVYAARVVTTTSEAPAVLATVSTLGLLVMRPAVGWAYHRAAVRPTDAWRPLQWGAQAGLAVGLFVYVAALFAVPFLDVEGDLGLLAQPALLAPLAP